MCVLEQDEQQANKQKPTLQILIVKHMEVTVSSEWIIKYVCDLDIWTMISKPKPEQQLTRPNHSHSALSSATAQKCNEITYMELGTLYSTSGRSDTHRSVPNFTAKMLPLNKFIVIAAKHVYNNVVGRSVSTTMRSISIFTKVSISGLLVAAATTTTTTTFVVIVTITAMLAQSFVHPPRNHFD